MLAVVPMAVGVAMGHPLQGSLYWALGVMSGEDDEEEEATVQSETIITDKNGNEIRVVGDVDEALLEKLKNGEALSDEEASNSEQKESVESESLSETPVQHQDQTNNLKRMSLFTRLQDKCRIILNQIWVYCTKSNQTVVRIIVGGIFSILILGFLAMMLRKTDYGGMILSIAFYMLFMCVMQALTALGLPELMQPSRMCIFFCYSLGLVWALNVDALIYLVFGWFKRNWVMNGASGVVLVAASIISVLMGLIRTPVTTSALEPNESIICLTNIIRENKTFNWTILSANDERQMIVNSGRHYEMITFLRQLMNLKKNPEITFPTEYVYFFIEKQPINYAGSANGIDLQPVSEEGASTPVNTGGGISAYTSDARWGTMSHMYYWAQAFRKLYPNELEVYYETDDFVCYKLHQNVECLYNLAIDYGYNNPQEQEEK